MPLSPGDEFNFGGKRYVIGAHIASGGMAAAYHATEHEMLFGVIPSITPVVAKIPNDWVLSQLDLLRRFTREARIHANVKHENIVKMIGLHELDDGTPVIIQELVENAQSLDTYVQARPESAPCLYLQALYALRAIHPNVVHRDASPSNLLVDGLGRLRLIDFGLAFEDPRLTQVLTRAGARLGTAGCISPEAIRDVTKVDGRADLFSVGKSFAAAISGIDPSNVMIHKLPAPWDSICENACDPDPYARYPNADIAIEDALQRFAGVPLHRMDLHIDEHARPGATVPKAWPTLCASYLATVQATERDLLPASKVPTDYFVDGWASQIFDRFESSPALGEVTAGHVAWETADHVGQLYMNLYPHLDPLRKEQCFRRLVQTGIKMNRYFVMGVVRGIYFGDPPMHARLLAIINAEDPPPNHTIYGRGIIPGRNP